MIRTTPRAVRARRRRQLALARAVGAVRVTVTLNGQTLYASDLDHLRIMVKYGHAGRLQHVVYGAPAGQGFTITAGEGQSLLDVLPRLVLTVEAPR